MLTQSLRGHSLTVLTLTQFITTKCLTRTVALNLNLVITFSQIHGVISPLLFLIKQMYRWRYIAIQTKRDYIKI